ncbi:hypothetical protein HSX37_02085|uniref:Uncharacterized protein n=1 Tax=Dendrosporobacter quercicolus TaxID=146817 RepID=A0A1G9LW37_9FIRM|nr:hypothetical protein [Dendrosporobacter quercicolus]NSL46843.1 hypothetical protein [Dendrosporobacter quercicolus DSM 1736]SDL66240.1 hypothetical protein SAMN04488502_101489 [Dendrosporobacter quercicolus]
MSNKTHAVGQLQGYMLQVRHMLFELISLEDIVVSVEKIDDVAIESPDESVIAEQLKSVTSDGNPATDRSVVFWKTLYNWFEYVRNGSLVLDKTIFRMVVVSNHELEVGDIAGQFHSASTKEEAQKALSAARLNIWGKDDVLRNSIPASYGQYLEVLFSPNNEELVSQIVSKIILDIHENDYDEKLMKKFNRQSIPTEFADSLFEYMLGWVTNKVNDYSKQGLPAVITSMDFRNALVAQNRMYDQRNSIPALSREITSDEARIEVENQDVYIQQLDLIQMDFDDKLAAASDYLRTKAETTIRAEKGLFIPQSSQEQDYNDRICRLWNNKRKQVLLLPFYSDVMKGKHFTRRWAKL